MTYPMLKPVEILLVEDNPGDARLAVEVMKDSKVNNRINHVIDGEEALVFLRKQGRYDDAPRPDLILLDLNLPKRSGMEVLSEIKADDRLKMIPVIILTVSSDEVDILKSYSLHANCFISKPIDLDQFIKVVSAIEDFWLSIVKLPRVIARWMSACIPSFRTNFDPDYSNYHGVPWSKFGTGE
jgi:chemotaxis family two-component system response regulator Rcp1